jgi:diguanylate cyclase (GGDEF)-like protein/PAS domain S-box-containing protein/excisionase family DNA binding protein
MTQRRTDASLLTTGEAAHRLNLSRYTLLRAVRHGNLTPAARTPGGFHRFRPADVDAYGRTLAPVPAPARAPQRPRPAPRGAGTWRAEAAHLAAVIAAQRDVALLGLDLDAVIALIVERTQALTRAAGAAIELTEGDEMVYRAASGAAAPHVGLRLVQAGSLSGRCVRTGEILRCDDAETDPRVDLVACRRVGARSMIVVPLHHERLVVGVLKVLAPAPQAFTERDVQTLRLLAGVLAAALSHAAAFAAERALVAAGTAALRASEERFRALTEQATDLVTILNAEGTVAYSSPSHARILGTRPAQDTGSLPQALVHPDDRAHVQAALAAAFATPGLTPPIVFRRRAADGTWRWLEAIGHNRLDDPAIGGLIVNSRDITERVLAEEALRHQALHDALTDLPNRTLLHDRLGHALRASRRDGRPLALLLLDLDRFKEVNDTFGHHRGDDLLRQVAARLRGALRASDTIARLGGDEFAALLPGADEGGARAVATALRAALDVPLVIAGQALQLGASIGVALAPAHGEDAPTLLRHADTAMYAAKHAGDTDVAVYDPAHDPHSPDRLALLAELREAITQGALALHYQPKVALATGQVHGVEALVRWPHPVHGLLPPDQFIPLAEQHGLIGPLTLWVLEEALRQGKLWARAGWDLNVAVNLSAWSLHDASLPDTIAALLRRFDAPPGRLRLELTEGSVMADAERALEVLTRLAALGVGLSVDDFGTGYSSLAYLKRLPVDEVKIDRSFVRDLATDEADAAIVHSTVGLGRSLGLQVVAEGVEDRATWDLLARMGCDVAQGYYLSRPLPAAAVADWLRAAPWAVA